MPYAKDLTLIVGLSKDVKGKKGILKVGTEVKIVGSKLRRK